MRTTRRTFLAASASLAVYSGARANGQAMTPDALRAEFVTPPPSARPRVWWHWMNGNVTAEGIRADLAWMQRVGIGGVQNFDASLFTPRFVDHPVPYLTDDWRQMFRGAVALADEKGLEFTIASSPGWSVTGGPWVRPEQAMKKLVWSETVIEGRQRFSGVLPQPPDVAGPFANISAGAMTSVEVAPPPAFYRDQCVIAYRAPDADVVLNTQASITTSAGAIDAAHLADGDFTTISRVPFGEGDRTWIQFSFDQPATARAVSVALPRAAVGPLQMPTPGGEVEASDDAVVFRPIATIPADGFYQTTIAFPSTRARHFRVSFPADRTPPDMPVLSALGITLPAPTATELAQLVLHGGARVDHFEEKAGFANVLIKANATAVADDDAAVHRRDVIDLTSRLRADGSLDWTPPAGRWIVLRFGYSLTGHLNSPASQEGTGLEVDKLNRAHVRAYADAYLGEYERTLGPELIGGRGLQYMLTDSFEAGASNWTDGMLEKFRARRGYDLRPWMPVLTGRVVESAEASERLLWDFRRTLADLIADEHYGQLSASLRERGMRRYGESHEYQRAFVGDGMEVKKSADIPMGAMWINRPDQALALEADLRESASVAHIYGQNLVAAESLTTSAPAFSYAPEDLKPTADLILALGVNRIIVHTSAHQPLDRPGPGATLRHFGQFFTRKETWAEQAGPWMDYLARASHLLQQGRYAADVLYFYGEDANVTALFSERSPPIPEGYRFDFANADVLLNEVRVRNGALTTRSGMHYKVLALDPHASRMSMPVLRKLRQLASAGVPIVGLKPTELANLEDDPARFARLAGEIWQAPSVSADVDIGAALTRAGVAPDFTYTKADADTRLLFLHRVLDDGDAYFISSRNDRAQTVNASFRVTGCAPELWRADSSTIRDLTYRVEGGRTIVPLELEPNDAAFVVFRTPSNASSRTIASVQERALLQLTGPWAATFPIDASEEKSVHFEQLSSWTERTDSDVKYFSGTATYRKTFELAQVPAQERIFLDLGEVKNLAEVLVNGRNMGVAWKRPFRIDITDAVQAGANALEVKVVNLWPNRLIGDKQPGATPRAWTTLDTYTAQSPLLPSGLLGPVTLVARTS